VSKLSSFFKDFVHIFFLKICVTCGGELLSHEDMLCSLCLYHLPLTDFHRDSENETARQLWGKLDCRHAMSMLYLAKSSRVEQLLYKLKYGHHPEIGVFFGEYYGKILQNAAVLDRVDIILPVPLHKSKLRKRGYNQSSQFAKGLSKASALPWADDILIRTAATVSQTTKSRTERYENVEGVFTLKETEAVQDKHILLVDDVLTTGATICAVGNLLIEAGATVSVATIARA